MIFFILTLLNKFKTLKKQEFICFVNELMDLQDKNSVKTHVTNADSIASKYID